MQFDEHGTWLVGPAPPGLSTFDFEILTRDGLGDPATVRIGDIRDPDPAGSQHEEPCADIIDGEVVINIDALGSLVNVLEPNPGTPY